MATQAFIILLSLGVATYISFKLVVTFLAEDLHLAVTLVAHW
jgi:hypothetical protein